MTGFVPRRRSNSTNSWTREEICMLRRLAAESVPVHKIAEALKRSTYAVRNKASVHGVSLKRRQLSLMARR